MTVVLTAVLLTAPIVAHGPVAYHQWLDDWSAEADKALSTELIDQLEDFLARHPDGQPVVRQAPASGESWRSLVAEHWRADLVEKALRVIACESGGDPDATNTSSGAAGLFQHLPKYWAERSTKAGRSGASIYDPAANVVVAAWLQRTGGWAHWPRCGR